MTEPRLSRVERSFLQAKRVPEEFVADMRHRADWASCSDELRAECRFFAWGFRTCDNGHRLTNGKGRCIQCHEATIGFVMRHARPGYVYIATSDCGRFVKVGIAADVDDRLRQLDAHRLGGVEHWMVRWKETCERPAKLEKELHRRLAEHRRKVTYERKGGQIGQEVYSCSVAHAIIAVAEIYAVQPDW